MFAVEGSQPCKKRKKKKFGVRVQERSIFKTIDASTQLKIKLVKWFVLPRRVDHQKRSV